MKKQTKLDRAQILILANSEEGGSVSVSSRYGGPSWAEGTGIGLGTIQRAAKILEDRDLLRTPGYNNRSSHYHRTTEAERREAREVTHRRHAADAESKDVRATLEGHGVETKKDYGTDIIMTAANARKLLALIGSSADAETLAAVRALLTK